MIKICIVTCNRAEYYKLEPIINLIHNSQLYELYLIVVGSHLVYDHGNTVDMINFPIYAKINTLIYSSNNKTMAESCALSMSKLPQIFDDINPDAVIIHGDRFDVLSVASTCALMNICLIHIEGGELTGTIDEHIRHAITKLSTYHFVSNDNAKKLLIQMGENKNDIFNVGCPSYGKIFKINKNIDYLKNLYDSDFSVEENNYILALYHPITTNLQKTLKEYEIYLNALIQINKKIILFYPNVDYGSKELIRIINRKKLFNNKNFLLVKTFPFNIYISLLYYSSCIVGNSSSGIREACIFGVPSITIGTRQNNRETSDNTFIIKNLDNKDFLIEKINEIYGKRYEIDYLYGDGNTIEKIDNILKSIEFKYKEKTFNIL
jgi:bifunctional UDP-N-acetylglucosamine 2-epimerase / N-acetylmannosamine kinase